MGEVYGILAATLLALAEWYEVLYRCEPPSEINVLKITHENSLLFKLLVVYTRLSIASVSGQ